MLVDRCSHTDGFWHIKLHRCSQTDNDSQMFTDMSTKMIFAHRCSHKMFTNRFLLQAHVHMQMYSEMCLDRCLHRCSQTDVHKQMFTHACWEIGSETNVHMQMGFVTWNHIDVHTHMGCETWIPEVFPKSRSVLVVDPTWVEEELSSCLSDPISSCLSDPRSKTLSDPRSTSLSEPRSSLGFLVFKIPFTGKQGRKMVYQ